MLHQLRFVMFDHVVWEQGICVTVQVTSAYYGQFNETCDSDCCVPDVNNDCIESVEENSPVDWVSLITQCNNQNHCDVLNGGGVLQSCTPTLVDYLMINYNCTPSMLFC